jgi:hypothetical protein
MLNQESVRKRLNELRHELERGYRRMAVLDKEREETRDTILRIKGAIQVLEELSQGDSQADRVASGG